jgi:drug/metabolite transporter (DMT)-like permease
MNDGIPLSPVLTRPSAAAVPGRGAPLGLVVAAFAAVYLIWGSTYLGITLAVKTIPPFLMAGARFVIAGAFLYVVLRRRGMPRPNRSQWGSAVVVGGLLLAGGNGGVSWAQGRVPSGVSALMIASVPLWIILVDWLRPGGRRPAPLIWLGLAAGGTGVLLIVLSRNPLGQRTLDPVGTVVLLASALSWALGSVYSRHSAKPVSALITVAMQMLAGGGLQLLTGFVLGEGPRFHPSTITVTSAGAFLYLTVMGSLVGYTAYVWLLQVSTPARVSTYAYVNPLVAVLLGHLVLKETLPPAVAVAGALILASVILITRPVREKS